MWTYHPELLATPVPRYTSYPTAADFTDGVDATDMAEAMADVAPDERISLYLHIPYCREICWYCGCNTGAANRTARLNSYLARLEQEIALIAAHVPQAAVGRIAFGGGSPNAIAPSQFDRLIDRIVASFRCADPILSVEIDPRGFTREWSAVLEANGVTRASLGVQTFDPAIQAAIGRVQPHAEIERAVALLRGAGVFSLNFDLMYGLPGQTDETLRSTLDQTLTLAPDRLAVFGYAHVPQMIPRQRRIDAAALPEPAARFRQAALAHGMLTGAGYSAIGFDHFGRPGDGLAIAARSGTLRRNFQGFTEDPARTLIGLGASSISEFPRYLLQNEKNTGRYHLSIGAGAFATTRGFRRSTDDRRRADAIEAILTGGSADLLGLSDLSEIRARLAPFAAKGLIDWQATTVRLSDDALPYARSIAAALDVYRPQNGKRFSSAV
jgi:oxygen-independent coproporphyrinogen-3 oxidase